MSPFVWLQLFALSLLWGLSFVLVGAVVHDTGAIQVAWARIAGGALFMLLFCLAVGQRLPGGRGFWLAAAAMGLLNNIVPFSLISAGQERIGPDLAAILNATTPFFAAIAAHLLTGDERLTLHRLAGIAIGIAAVAVLIGPAAWQAVGGGWDPSLRAPQRPEEELLASRAGWPSSGWAEWRFNWAGALSLTRCGSVPSGGCGRRCSAAPWASKGTCSPPLPCSCSGKRMCM